MKDKTLFDDFTPPLDDGPLGNSQLYFASFAELCGPVQAWMERRFGTVRHYGTFRYLEADGPGFTVKARLYDADGFRRGVEWSIRKPPDKPKIVGWSEFGADLDRDAPPAVVQLVQFPEGRE